MNELPGKIRVQDATLANMVSIAAILEYLDKMEPGSKSAIELRAQEIARSIKTQMDNEKNEKPETEA